MNQREVRAALEAVRPQLDGFKNTKGVQSSITRILEMCADEDEPLDSPEVEAMKRLLPQLAALKPNSPGTELDLGELQKAFPPEQ